MIAVIADDITGAAEMAGIAHRLGLRVKLTVEPAEAPGCDVIVVATDTRSMSESEAAAESRRVASALASMPEVEHIFKKTDSALRGHVVAELEAIISATLYTKALYIPANPSKGRIIRDGVYYVGDKPIHETDFSFDPEFPAFSSKMAERFPECEVKGIEYADAVSEDDMVHAVSSAGNDTILAGAADLFTAFLKHHLPVDGARETETFTLDTTDTLIVCGSTQSKPIDCGIETLYMPTTLYDGETTADSWADVLEKEYDLRHSLILAIRDRHRTGKEIAVHLRETTGHIVQRLVGHHAPTELVIEGGATAYAILRKLGWESFTITHEIAPGVIRMRSDNGTHITMKPGSYPWGGLFAS